jgi:hypothetical protein
MNAPVRTFEAKPAVRGEEPLSIGMIGPPGGGKTLSSLKIARGIQSVRGGDIVLIDTEGGRSRKYAELIPFRIVEFAPPCKPEHFLEAIKQQLPSKPACIIVDSMSDEHEGEGGYLEWHDEMIPKMGGNEWAAWSKPKASRKRLIAGILHIKTPLIFTFRAREKTKQDGKKVVNIGWQPVAPLEIVHGLDLTCILPPRADGVPVWKSDKIGEDFIIKLPNYLRPFIGEGQALCEDMGAAFARWAKGSPSPAPAASPAAPDVSTNTGAAGSEDESERLAELDGLLANAATAGTKELQAMWTTIPADAKPALKAALDRRHKPAAADADARK